MFKFHPVTSVGIHALDSSSMAGLFGHAFARFFETLGQQWEREAPFFETLEQEWERERGEIVEYGEKL
jgi:hypothetical protein